MLLNKFENWRLAIKELNSSADELSKNRDECYSWMANKIKESFKRAGNPAPFVHFEDDASEIICSWDNDSEIIIPVTLILDLHMSFSFDKQLTTDGTWKKILIFYPLMEDL